MPVTRPTGRALLVAAPSARPDSLKTLSQLGFECAEADEPYSAFVELCNHRLAYHAVILSLSSIYRDELTVITTIKRLWPHIDVWLSHTDGRHAAMAEGVRLGADGLLAEDGLHRLGQLSASVPLRAPSIPIPVATREHSHDSDEMPSAEPVLTSDELRALLQDQPSLPPFNSAE
jgi:DNA-binding NarL/FixJ family response regulator